MQDVILFFIKGGSANLRIAEVSKELKINKIVMWIDAYIMNEYDLGKLLVKLKIHGMEMKALD